MSQNNIVKFKRESSAVQEEDDIETKLSNIMDAVTEVKYEVGNISKQYDNNNLNPTEGSVLWREDGKYILTSDNVDVENEKLQFKGYSVITLCGLYKKGSIFLAFICLSSLIVWFSAGLPLVHPFIAALGLFSSPFFYAMGKVAEKGTKKWK